MGLRSIVKKFIPAGLFPAIEPYGHLAEAVLLNTINGFPGRGLKVIGVTGTNGKTSTCFLIHRMLHEAGYKVGLMTTVGYGVGAEIKPQVHHMTNVSVPELMQRLKWMKKQGVEWLVLETTSHALAQNRVWGIPYSVAVMTNVTHEHLDYHRTFERYRDAKRKLFKLANRNRKGLRTGIINAEDPSAKLFAGDIRNPVLYGVGKGDLSASNVKLSPAGVSYTAEIQDAKYEISCKIPGSFNVYNSLAAVGVGHVLGLSKEQIEKGIAALEGVEGRMTRIDEGQNFDVIVDFAHTPDSFEKLFKDLKPVVKGKLIAMFGSAGRRDEAKRAVQGELAGEYCDEVIVTEEDDRDVDGQEIMNQIAAGAEKTGKVRGKDLFLVHDRTEAIKFTLNRASKGDTVLLLGKGHEKTIERADGEHPWAEIGTTRQALKSLDQR
ncbi:MAG TPA: UDP-N-acetylmuramoyl-L-alanyl-D-glutamate--2,6-diaminopimelate ligase [Candidatus Saccharimonadales bacterium]|nr:UDP-N-acetylmuramoyl-L-alanyl-D-glutamate--2,6-diaminopimelate ligase [Candidatus Saccharimonadales bacterium]